MKITMNPIFASVQGNIGEYYIRTLNGELIMQRKPGTLHPPTKKQIECRKKFADKYSPRANNPS